MKRISFKYLCFLVVFGLQAFAGFQKDILEVKQFEIPPSLDDIQLKYINEYLSLKVKDVKCNGKEFGIIYRYDSSWSEGTTEFIAICKKSVSRSYESCVADTSKETLACHNKAVKFYKIENRYPVVDLSQISDKKKNIILDLPNLDMTNENGVK